MSHTMTLELPEEVYNPLAESAGSNGETPEEIALRCLAAAAQQIRSEQSAKSNGQPGVGSHPKVRRAQPIDLSREMKWLKEHRHEYMGQWVALDGDRLIAHGPNAREVYQAARETGIVSPFLEQILPTDELPFGGW
jgi:hypothetical protein